MLDWITHQNHRGVQEQVTLTHIYRLIYKHFISSALCPLKGILKQISGWRVTHYNYLQMVQLGKTTRKLDKSRYIGNRLWLQFYADRTWIVKSNNIEYLTGKMISLVPRHVDLNGINTNYILVPAIYVTICLLQDSDRKYWQELRGKACCLWYINKIFTIPATNEPGWDVYENRGIWSEKKPKWVWSFNVFLHVCFY